MIQRLDRGATLTAHALPSTSSIQSEWAERRHCAPGVVADVHAVTIGIGISEVLLTPSRRNPVRGSEESSSESEKGVP